MVKKKKDTLEDIMDRIQEDIDTLRDRVYDLENQVEEDSSDSDDDSDWDDSEDEDEEDKE